MSLFSDGEPGAVRRGADWESHRRHRLPFAGPPRDEIGGCALAGFELARTAEVVVAVRSVTAYSDGLLFAVAVLFADEQRAEDLVQALRDFGRAPGRFRFGVVFADGRRAVSGVPQVQDDPQSPALTLLYSTQHPLLWEGAYWLHPLPPAGPLVLGNRWPDRGIAETLVKIDSAPLLTAAARSQPVWGQPR